MARDIFKEIDEITSRQHKRSSRIALLVKRIAPIVAAKDYLIDRKNAKFPHKQELLRHIPVSVIAAAEGYFRLGYQNMIDKNEAIRNQYLATAKDKLSVKDLAPILENRHSLGAYVAHTMPFNSVSDIFSNFEKITGDSLKPKMLFYISKQFNSVGGNDVMDFLCKDMDEAFSTRHILAHELATKVRITNKLSDHIVRSFVTFSLNHEYVLNDYLQDTVKYDDF